MAEDDAVPFLSGVSQVDRDLLATIRKRWTIGIEAVEDQLQREIDDIKFYNGAQFSEELTAARTGKPGSGSMPPLPARPMFVINETRPPVLQIINQIRGSEFDFALTAADDFADVPGAPPARPNDDPEIQLREGLVRRIQRAQETADARLWAAMRATIAGRGFYRVMVRYLPGQTFDREVYVDRIYNQSAVVVDPSHESPDGADAQWYFLGSDLNEVDYKAQFKDAEDGTINPICDLTDDEFRTLGDAVPTWFRTDEKGHRMYRVMEHFYTEFESKVLCDMEGGPVWESEVPKGTKIPKENKRTVVTRTIKWVKTDGCQILERTDWPSPDLNLIKVLGEELQPEDDGEKKSEGMVRPMRDPAIGKNIMVNKFLETVGYAPNPAPMATVEQIGPYQKWYEAAATHHVPFKPYVAHVMGGSLVPPPFYPDTAGASNVSAIGGGLEMFSQALQAVSLHDPSLGRVDPSLKSGVALKTLVAAGAQGMSHYLDNLKRSVRREALVTNNLLYPIYGKKPGRLVRIVTGTGELQTITIAPAPTPGGAMPPNGAPATPAAPPVFRLTEGTNYNIAVKLTPSSDSRNAEMFGILSELMGKDPQAMLSVYGDVYFEYMQAAGAKELSERAKVMLDPKVLASIAAKNGGAAALPPEAQAHMAKMGQQIQTLEGIAHAQQQEIQSKKAELDSKERIVGQELASKERMAAADRETKLAVAELGAKVDRMTLFLEERARLGTQDHDAAQSELDRQHDRTGQVLDLAHDAATTQVGHDAATDAADQGHAQTMEQAQQAADLAPEPTGATE